MTLVPTDRWADQPPGFNRAAAEVIFKRIMDQPDDETARLYALMLLGGALEYDLDHHGELIYKAVQADLDYRYQVIKRHFARNAVSKQRAGQDPTKDLEALGVVVKAYDPNQPRDYYGKWTAHPGLDLRPMVALKGKEAQAQGIPKPWGKKGPVKLKGESLANYQQAYEQIADWLRENRVDNPGLGTRLRVEITDKNGKVRRKEAPAFRRGQPMRVPLEDGDTITHASYQIPGGDNLGIVTFQQLTRMGQPGLAGYIRDEFNEPKGVLNKPGLEAFGRDWRAAAEGPNAQFTPGMTAIQRVGQTSGHIADLLPENAPIKLKVALRVAEHTGRMGPEAQRILGPTADRLAYRFRGTARTPAPALRNALDSIRRDENTKNPEDKRELMIHGREVQIGRRTERRMSGVMHYFRRQVPSPELNRLQLAAGNVPPSRGIIFNRNGQVSAEYVGVADDHYLPFDLKHLTNLKGGEYIRTRTWGGPTTEDIYTGLMTGARALSVVSNNGVYVVEFDPNLRGGRRFNDKALRMVNRYGHILDAVASKQVSTGEIDPDREDEIRAEVEYEFEGEEGSPAARAEIQRRLVQEKRKPTFSRTQKLEVAQEFLEAEARRQATKTGGGQTPQEMVDDFVNRQVAARALAERSEAAAKEMPEDQWELNARGGYRLKRELHPRANIHAPRGREQLRDEVMREYGMDDEDPLTAADNTIEALGLQDRYEKFRDDKLQQYVRDLKPMALNGVGYDKALNALKEQFPYYIQDVNFYPWREVAQRQDTGYVMPRHNRPAAAMAGYFANEIAGGKVSAHTTRYQNNRERPALTSANILGKPAKELEGPEKVGSGEAPAVAPKKLSPEAEANLRYKADLDVLRAVKAMTTISDDAHGERNGYDAALLKNKTKEQVRAYGDLAKIVPNIDRVWSTPEMDLENMDPEQAHRLALAVLAEEKEHHIVGIDQRIIQAHERGGRKAEPKKLNRDNLVEMLRSPDDDIADLGAMYYYPSPHHKAEDLKRFTEATLGEKRKALGLPEIDSADFLESYHAKVKQLKKQRERMLDLEQNLAEGARVKGSRQLAKDIETTLRIGQLQRRYQEAVQVANLGQGALRLPKGSVIVRSEEGNPAGFLSPSQLASRPPQARGPRPPGPPPRSPARPVTPQPEPPETPGPSGVVGLRLRPLPRMTAEEQRQFLAEEARARRGA